MNVTLNIPDAERLGPDGKPKSPDVHGEHLAYHGRAGVILAPAGNGGVWVQFDLTRPDKYVGCPLKFPSRA